MLRLSQAATDREKVLHKCGKACTDHQNLRNYSEVLYILRWIGFLVSTWAVALLPINHSLSIIQDECRNKLGIILILE